MPKIKVLHFVRKSTQLKASFINNQIAYHQLYEPCIVFREKRSADFDGGFADFNLVNYKYLDLSDNDCAFEKIRYKSVKTLSKRQTFKTLNFIDKSNIQICHFHYGTDCGVFFPLLKYLKIKTLVSFYGYDCSSFSSKFFGYGKIYLKNRVFKHVDIVLAMSPDMKTDLIKAGCNEDKIIVHYYGTDTDRFYFQKEYEQKDCITLLILATLVPQKGHLFLLRSLKHLFESGINNFHLRIVGGGELETELKAFVSNNNLAQYVSFIGVITYGSKQMHEEYNNADVFIHPSVIAPNGDKEGIPGTIVEAMSAGLPVISTYHAGIPYIIENSNTGILVKEHDILALSEAIKKLIENVELRNQIGVQGQNYACKYLNLKNKEIELESIYQSK